MTDYLIKLDDILTTFLQKNIRASLNDSQFRTGKFILYTHNYFSFNVNIFNFRKKKREILKLPIPFVYEYYEGENLLYFDYRLKSFSHGNIEIENLVNDIPIANPSKFYNKILTIEAIKDE